VNSSNGGIQREKSFERLTIIGFAIFTLVIAAVFYRQGTIAAEHSRVETNSREVRNHLQSVLIKIKEVELGQYVYGLTGDTASLVAYNETPHGGRKSMPGLQGYEPSLSAEFQDLKRLVANDPSQKKYADSLEALALKHSLYAEHVITLRREQGIEAAIQGVRTGKSQRLWTETRAVIMAMQEHENALLSRLEQTADRQRRLKGILLYGILGAFYLPWLLSFWAAAKSRKKRLTAERSLKESHELFKAVIDGTDYTIFGTDANGIVTVFNRGAERMLGYKAEEEIGTPVSIAAAKVMLPEEVTERSRKILAQYGRPPEGLDLFRLPLDGDGPYGMEWTYVRKDGSRLSVAVSVSMMENGGTVAIARDITPIKALERMKNEFISTVSHELRTPLTSIRGALGLVAGGATGALPEKAAELVSIAYRNSERLVRIINDILDVEKLEFGQMSLHMAPVNVAEFLRQAVEINAAYGEKHGVRFVLRDVPEAATVSADPDRLMQIMANLLSNAAKFSPRDAEVWLGAEIRGDQVRIFVRDFGSGIPDEFRSRIFEKFAQADTADSRHLVGTGLGLNISRSLVEAMAGKIGFNTEAGRGTEFFFELPHLEAQAEAVAPEVLAQTVAPSRILICEDDPDVAALLKILLERAGFAADTVQSLQQTRSLLRENAYAALTLDLKLPDGEGLKFLQELRADLRWESLPVIIVSAKADEARQELHGDAIGVVDWIVKPIDEVALVRSLRHMLAGSHEPRILHVEDDADLSRILGRALEGKVEWVGAPTLREAKNRLAVENFDLVVLDLGLPDGSGVELLECLKQRAGAPIPVLILSAEETDESMRLKVAGTLVKSRISEECIVQTILGLIRSPASSGSVGSQIGIHQS
jgi:signal transduction histidine kinase/DNA-binding response OmpR family regulator/CHASE3 domain sensor protein